MGYTPETTTTRDADGNVLRVRVDGDVLEGVETFAEAAVFGVDGDEQVTLAPDDPCYYSPPTGDSIVLDESTSEGDRVRLGSSSYDVPEIVVEYLEVATDGGRVGDSKTVEACPKCKSSSIRERKHTGGGRPPESDHRFKCGECRHAFDEPLLRAPITGASGPSLRKLIEADPDVDLVEP